MWRVSDVINYINFFKNICFIPWRHMPYQLKNSVSQIAQISRVEKNNFLSQNIPFFSIKAHSHLPNWTFRLAFESVTKYKKKLIKSGKLDAYLKGKNQHVKTEIF